MAAPSLIYGIAEKAGRGRSFSDIMGYFVPAYLISSVIYLLTSGKIDISLIIFLGFIGGLVLIAIDLPRFTHTYFFKKVVGLYIGGPSYRAIELEESTKFREFYYNLRKDLKFTAEIYRCQGYSYCFFHLSIGMIILAVLFYFNVIATDFNVGLKELFFLILLAFASFSGFIHYQKMMYITQDLEIRNFLEKEPVIKDDSPPLTKNETLKTLIENRERNLRLLQENRDLISEESVDEKIAEIKDELSKYRKERLDVQIELFNQIHDIIGEIEDQLTKIDMSHYANLNEGNSLNIKTIKEIKDEIKKSLKILSNNKFNSVDIPTIFKNLKKYDDYVIYSHSLIELESLILTIKSRLEETKSVAFGKERKFENYKHEVSKIEEKFQSYIKNKNKTESFYILSVYTGQLKKIDAFLDEYTN